MVSHTWCSPPGVRRTPQSRGGGCPPRPALADGLRLFESSLCCLFESESLVKFPHGVPYPVFPRPYPQFGMEVASRPGEDRLMDLRLHGRCQSTPIGVVEGEQIANSVHVRAAPMRSQPETRRSCCRTARPIESPLLFQGWTALTPTRMSTLVDIPRMEVALTPTRMSTLVDIPKMEVAFDVRKRTSPCNTWCPKAFRSFRTKEKNDQDLPRTGTP